MKLFKRYDIWIFFVYMFFKTNYIIISLRYVTFHVQVEIGLYVMSPTLKSFSRPFIRLWFYAAFSQIGFGSSVRSFHWNYTIKFRCAVALWKSWVCKYSIRFQNIKLKLLCKTLKNEKWKMRRLTLNELSHASGLRKNGSKNFFIN